MQSIARVSQIGAHRHLSFANLCAAVTRACPTWKREYGALANVPAHVIDGVIDAMSPELRTNARHTFEHYSKVSAHHRPLVACCGC